jgi:tetratricopeptide (TPR) repeat protein
MEDSKGAASVKPRRVGFQLPSGKGSARSSSIDSSRRDSARAETVVVQQPGAVSPAVAALSITTPRTPRIIEESSQDGDRSASTGTPSEQQPSQELVVAGSPSTPRRKELRTIFVEAIYKTIQATWTSLLQAGHHPDGRGITPRRRLYYEWRIGYYYYLMHDYEAALKILENVCKCEPTILTVTDDDSSVGSRNSLVVAGKKPLSGQKSPVPTPGSGDAPSSADSKRRSSADGKKSERRKAKEGPSVYKMSVVHLTAARCRLQLFQATKLHSPHLEIAYVHYQNAIETLNYDLSTMFKLPAIFFELGKMLEVFGAFDTSLDMYGKILSGFANFRGELQVDALCCMVVFV